MPTKYYTHDFWIINIANIHEILYTQNFTYLKPGTVNIICIYAMYLLFSYSVMMQY